MLMVIRRLFDPSCKTECIFPQLGTDKVVVVGGAPPPPRKNIHRCVLGIQGSVELPWTAWHRKHSRKCSGQLMCNEWWSGKHH